MNAPRRHPQDGSTQGAGSLRARIGRAFATRASSSPAGGSGARSLRRLSLASLVALAATLLLGVAGASAAAPAVTIENASSVSYLSAHVKGTVDPGGEPTTYRFQYISEAQFQENLTNSLPGFEGATTGIEVGGFEGTGAQPVEGELTGLAQNTTYHLRLQAENAESAGVPAEAIAASTFTTKEVAKPVVTIENASEVSYQSAKAEGTVELANEDPAFNSSCVFEYITNAQFEENIANSVGGFEGAAGVACEPGAGTILGTEAQPVSVSANLAGLTQNTTYHLRLSATNSGGTTNAVAASTFTTKEVTKPVVTVENASGVSYLSAKAEGSVELANADPAFNTTGCEFQYATEADFSNAAAVPCEPSTVEGAGAHSVSANLTGLAPSTTYHLRIVAANPGGSASEEAAATFETLAVAVPSVTVAEPTEITGHGAQVSGEVNPEGSDPAFDASCEFQYATAADFSDAVGVPCEPATVKGAGPQPVKATLTGLRAKTTYHLRLLATNAGGTGEAVAAAPFATEGVAPTIESTSVANLTQTSVELQAQIDPEGELTTYRFEYIADGSNYSEHGFANATRLPASPSEDPSLGAGFESKLASLTLEGLSPDTLYHFRVRATSSFGTATGPAQTFRTYAGPAGGLPDGRVYEQVSPSNKHGFDAGVNGDPPAGFAAADGNSVMYISGNGGIAEDTSNGWQQSFSVASRTSHGWISRSTNPRGFPGPAENPEQNNIGGFAGALVNQFAPSADLSHFFYSTNNHKAALGPPDETGLAGNYYLAGPDPMAAPQWPSSSNPTGAGRVAFLGGSPDFSTIYFFSSGLLGPSASGFYEYRNGVLSDAGELPAGMTSPTAAAPAVGIGLGSSPAQTTEANVVSADGSRAFFTREDEAGKTQLFAHLTAGDGSQHSLLVSQSQLPGQVGQPAPSGVLGSQTTQWYFGEFANHIGQYPDYVHASSDGVHAFFLSTDRLTEDAPVGTAPKAYDFNLDSGELQYLPGVSGSIVASASDGSAFLFEDTSSSPFELEYWSAGPNGGTVKQIAELPQDGAQCGIVCVGPAQVSGDGSSVVFSTESPIPGFNDAGGFKQVFRYEAATAQLSCISCAPAGVAPSGAAVMSHVVEMANSRTAPEEQVKSTVVDSRAVSGDGSRVFFDTPAKLVAADTNGNLDVYEWEADGVGSCQLGGGCLSLVSSGTSSLPSFFIGSSPSGNDAFIVTADGLVPSDIDESYDVYDVRVPRPGDQQPPPPVPCQGEACREAPSSAAALPGAASASFEGPGNQKHKKHRKHHHRKHHHKKHGAKKSNRRGGHK